MLSEMAGNITMDARIPAEIKEFLQGFAVLRTIFKHVDPVTKEAQYTHQQITQECNLSIKNTPVFTKVNLSYLKSFLRKHGFLKTESPHDILALWGKNLVAQS